MVDEEESAEEGRAKVAKLLAAIGNPFQDPRMQKSYRKPSQSPAQVQQGTDEAEKKLEWRKTFTGQVTTSPRIEEVERKNGEIGERQRGIRQFKEAEQRNRR